MNPAAIAILYRMEIRSILRDRRVILFSFVLPFLLAPLLLLVSGSVKRAERERADHKVITLAVSGPSARSSEARKLVEAAAKRDPEVAIAVAEPPSGDPEGALRRGEIDAYLEMLDAADASQKLGEDAMAGPPGADPDMARLPVIVVYYREDRTASRSAEEKVRRLLIDHRRELRDQALLAKGLPRAPPGGAWLVSRDVATQAELSGSRAGLYLTALILLFMLVGGASIASDSIAGEKERGTLETLLSAGVGRKDLLAAKLLLIFTATVSTTIIQIINLSVCFALGLTDASTGPLFQLPLRAAPLLALLFLPVSALVASVLVLLFGMAKTYKEAQLYFTPLTIAGPVLALAPALPGLELRSAVVLVPLVNISVAVKEILLGKFDWPMISLAWIVTAAAAVLVARAAERTLSAERLILSGGGEDPKDGQGRLGARVLGWFAALWALYFLLSASSAGASITTSVVLGQALLLGATALLLRRYKLDARRALSLRPVSPIVWPAVLLGAPSGAIVAEGLFRVVSRFLPVPREMLEQLAQKLTPEGMPAWQMLLLFAVLPGVCEELTFRGVLLHGLRRKLGPVALCLVVGAVFGLFHMALFRLATTAFLGALLTAVVLVTGSIFPSILWHCLNNAIALAAARLDIHVEALPWWAYLMASLSLSASFLMLWRGRVRATDGAAA